MIVSYTKLPSRNPVYPAFWRPLLGIELSHGVKTIPVKGIIDTGADYTLMNKQIAEQLGIAWDTGRKSPTMGITGTAVVAYIHDVEIEIIRLKNSKRKIPVAFIDSANVGILLGQIGFFDNFLVRFDYPKKIFAVELP